MTVRNWIGTVSAEWTDDANWTPTGAPVAGDTAIIGSGLTPGSDFVVLDTVSPAANVTIQLGVDGGTDSATLDLDNSNLLKSVDIVTRGYAGDLSTPPGQTILARDSNLLNGFLESAAIGEELDIVIGTTSNPGTFTVSTTATMLDGPESGTRLLGDTFINQGVMVIEGGLHIDNADFDLSDAGQVIIQQGGTVTADIGADVTTLAGATGSFDLADGSATLVIDDLADFNAPVKVAVAGARLEFATLAANGVSYGDGILTLLEDGTAVGSISVNDPDGGGAADFSIQTPALPGAPTVVTYDPVAPALELSTMPVPAVVAPGGTLSATALLEQAFGTIPAAWTNYRLNFSSAADLARDDFSYWNLDDKQISQWSVPNDTDISASQLNDIDFLGGNEIGPLVSYTVPITSSGSTTAYASYTVQTADPSVVSPTIYSGHVTPNDIVQSAIRLDEAYGGTYNNNDCGFIADAVAGDAGAGFPQNDVFSDEQGGGFWRVVYSGADQVDPVQNWSTLVQPGDIVKMAWLDGGGHHVTTVVGTLTSGGLLPVFDNGDNDTIHIHDVDYWKGTDPASIIIFRLDPNQQYLIQGTDQGEFIQGSPYDNLIQPGLGADTIAAGASNSEMQGAAADLNGDTVNDFHTGDWFDLTDLDPSTATASYDATTGMLAVASSGSTVATINLPTSLLNNFAVLPDGSGGTQITDVACFAAGTRIRTPNGDVAAERLCPGDEVLTITGAARRITWVGHRRVDCRRHPNPKSVWPVRIRADAFAPGVPQRDLRLSPDHAIFAEGVLIPVKVLIDGDAVRQIRAPSIRYVHIETESHDVILAENLPCETFLDTGMRDCFDNGGNVVRLFPDFSPPDSTTILAWETRGHARLCLTGSEVARVPAHLARRSADCARDTSSPHPTYLTLPRG